MPSNSREKQIIRVSLVGIAANLLLVVLKLTVGVLSRSIAIVLDGVNNASDMLSSVITVAGTRLAEKPADRHHPFGHGRYEYISAAVVSAVILYAGLSSLEAAVEKILTPETPDYSPLTLAVVSAAVLVKLLLGRFTARRGRLLRSDALVNSGHDALLDAGISFTTLLAALIYLLFGRSLEAWLGALISLLILRSGVQMLREMISKILGERVDGELARTVRETVCQTPGVEGAYDLVLNSYGPDRWIGSVNIEVPDTWTAGQIDAVSREISQRVLDRDHVILTAIGIYARNTADDAAAEMRSRITEIALGHDYVLQLHGFYCDTAQKSLRFDLVIDLRAPDREAIRLDILDHVKRLYPDYTAHVQSDADFSD